MARHVVIVGTVGTALLASLQRAIAEVAKVDAEAKKPVHQLLHEPVVITDAKTTWRTPVPGSRDWRKHNRENKPKKRK